MIYRTRFGDEYNVARWPKEHRQFLQQAYWWYVQDTPYEEFTQRILGPDSPVLNRKKNGPVPTRTPLYEVVTDLEFRLGVKQGHFLKDWDGPVDPEWPESGRNYGTDQL